MKNTAAKLKKEELKAQEILDELYPDLTQRPNHTFFERLWADLLNKITNEFKTIKSLKIAHNYLVKVCIESNQNYNWGIVPPSYIVTVKHANQLRLNAFFKTSNALQGSYFNFFHKIESKQLDIKDPHVAYSNLMISFLCHSAICDVDVLHAISTHLTKPLSASFIHGVAFIDIEYKSKTANSNVYNKNGEAICLKRCYLSPITLNFLNYWNKYNLKAFQTPAENPKEEENKLVIFYAITQFMDKNEYFPKTLSSLCKHAITIPENAMNCPLPQALIEYSVNRIDSYSLPIDNLASLANKSVFNYKATQYGAFKSPLSNSISHLTEDQNGHSTPYFYDKLNKAFQRKKGDRSDITLLQLTKRLTALNEEITALNQKMLLQWLIQYCIKEKAVSTIRQYKSTISRKFLEFSNNEDLTLYDSSNFEDLYISLTALAETDKNKYYIAGRLIALHQFSVNNFGLPPLSESFELAGIAKKHTRAGFIGESTFLALLNVVEQLTDLKTEEKSTLQSIFIIAYRTGLRQSEILQLRIKDIEYSNVGWIKVRKGKTDVARRRVPLIPLLLENEKVIIEAHLRHRKEISTSRSNLFFTLGIQTTDKQINKYQLSNFTSQALRGLSGLPYLVFHHFRHSCLSRLQLMLTNSENLAQSELIPYSAKTSKIIIEQLICGKTRRNTYYAIAKFAGHETPSTTFKSYFHFSDYILGYLVSNADIEINQFIASKFFKLNKHYFNTHKNSTSVLISSHYQEESIKQFSKLVALPKISPNKQLFTAELYQKKPNYTITTCYRVLEKYQNGEDLQQIGDKLRVDQTTLNNWVENAQKIKNITTKYGNSRLFSNERADKLLPASLLDNNEVDWAEKVLAKIRDNYTENKKPIKQNIWYALNHISPSKSGISFTSPDELTQFIENIDFAIPASHWRIIFIATNKKQVSKEWKNSCKKFKTMLDASSPKTKEMMHSVRLELIHPNEEQIKTKRNAQKYSSNALLYLFHMMAIMLEWK